ncbi:MAG: class I SAM-dependent methyltransferase [Oligoflexia bacterium]|nr:class I SAM-dependent methyltransferase [Oligoflexia bacterium]
MSVRENELGFFEIWPKPSEEDLEKYYNDKYFAANKGQYSASYSTEEIRQKYVECEETFQIVAKNHGSLLDIGCGEGFFLDWFKKKGWNVVGADFTSDGIRHFFPSLEAHVKLGSVFQTIEDEVNSGRRYDLVCCNNILEHVLNPLDLLEGIKKLMAPGGICRIVVPNDYSYLQRELVARGLTKNEFWIFNPDHQNYFNADSLPIVLEKSGLRVKRLLSDFPIDMFLFNPDSNYVQDPQKGKNCHKARVMIETMMASQGIEKLVSFREGCAKSGVGRSLIAYCALE